MPLLSKTSELVGHELFDGYTGRFVHSDTMTIAYWDIKAGKEIPVHSHPHEQIVNCLVGHFRMWVDGKRFEMQPGDVLWIPSGSVHSALAVTACRTIDIFSPVRLDYQFPLEGAA
jgi:quercetin dioxygenase-like cupin family protein